jgi:antitoxin component YwqK of YwqJK toxin-antitoxin module
MKNLICFFLLISFFSFSQVEIPIIDFASGDYPVGEKVKILYDKGGKPVTEIDSAAFYRIVKFKEKNIPLGKVIGYFISGEKQNTFYASYLGLSKAIKDSVYGNGSFVWYYKNGNKSLVNILVEDVKFGFETSYFKNGKIKSNSFYENGLKQGEEIGYYESGAVDYTINWVDGDSDDAFFYYESGAVQHKMNFANGLKHGEQISYYESGTLELKRNWVDGLRHGEEIVYYESGAVVYKGNWVNGLKHGERISYYESGAVKHTENWVDDLKQGEETGYHESGAVSYKINWVDDLKQGEEVQYSEYGEVLFTQPYANGVEVDNKQIFYYESGTVESKVNLVNGLKQGEQIGYYESGEVEFKTNWVDDLLQGEQIGYYESGTVNYKINLIDDLKHGEEVFYYESGGIEYKRSWTDGLKHGEEVFYYESGEIDYTLMWEDGKLQERRIALVIGNAAYLKGPLENPVNDANLIAESLEKLDFEVELYNNLASRDKMLDAIKYFGRKRKNYEIAFVYYAGHGIQLDNENYLLPVNEEFEFEDDVEDNGVSMQRVLRYLESTRENQLNFIVLDACRDNPFESNWNKTRSLKGAGLAKTPPPTGSLIAFSTDHGQTAADGDGGNSLYSQALAEKLLEENVSIEQVFKNVRTEVLRLSGDTQSPVEESKLTGNAFYLNKTNK